MKLATTRFINGCDFARRARSRLGTARKLAQVVGKLWIFRVRATTATGEPFRSYCAMLLAISFESLSLFLVQHRIALSGAPFDAWRASAPR